MDWSHLQNEHRIRVQQVLDRAERENTLSLVTKKSKEEIESAMTRVKCWVCMDKSLVWGNRGSWLISTEPGPTICYCAGPANPTQEGNINTTTAETGVS